MEANASFSWVSVKVAQKSHKLQEGVQFPHPPLINKLNIVMDHVKN
jgi:hypothetical protein